MRRNNSSTAARATLKTWAGARVVSPAAIMAISRANVGAAPRRVTWPSSATTVAAASGGSVSAVTVGCAAVGAFDAIGCGGSETQVDGDGIADDFEGAALIALFIGVVVLLEPAADCDPVAFAGRLREVLGVLSERFAAKPGRS